MSGHDARCAASGTIGAIHHPSETPLLNSLFADLGLASWKPIISALLLPPVPFLFLILIGARLLLPRRGLGWLVILVGVAGVWLGGCTGAAQLIDQFLLKPPHELSRERIGELKAKRSATTPAAIVVLGGGLEPFAPEYGVANLGANSVERLRYGLWLGKETGLPVAISGGLGWGGAAAGGASEAEVAARIAAQEFGRPLRWTEADSRDTRENAARSVGLLHRAGIQHIVLVTSAWHMPRALRAFKEAAQAKAPGMAIEAAPTGLATRVDKRELDWVPTTLGLTRVRNSVHEVIGIAAGG